MPDKRRRIHGLKGQTERSPRLCCSIAAQEEPAPSIEPERFRSAAFGSLPRLIAGPKSPANVTLQQVELPLSVRDAALYLGVSTQTVYLWVERKQIPNLRVMGRNIRFLKSDLEPFRASFKQEVENGKTE